MTVFDIDLDVMAESFLVVFSGDNFLHFFDTEVAC